MQTVDILIGVFAVIALGGSVVGVVLYEPSAASEFGVFYSTETHELGSEDTSVSGGGPNGGTSSAEVTHDIGISNLTELVFEVQVTSQSALPARSAALSITVTVTDPNGTETREDGSISGTGTSTTIEVRVPNLNEVPVDGAIQAESLEAAATQANETNVGTNGIGEWTVTVEVTYPAGLAAESGTVTSTPRATHYHSEVRAEVPDISPAA